MGKGIKYKIINTKLSSLYLKSPPSQLFVSIAGRSGRVELKGKQTGISIHFKTHKTENNIGITLFTKYNVKY